MVSPCPNLEATLVHSLKLSSVGPGCVSGPDMEHAPTNMDLAMKLHYLRFIYYFPRQAVVGLRISDYKEAMFEWLNQYYVTCGRLRRAVFGRPYIKCNDCGVRVIEAHCEKTIGEWLEFKDSSMEKILVYGQSIGPELQNSPLVFIQLTTFKCGGLSLGVSWAHILGDAFVATRYMAALGRKMAGRHKLGDIDNHFQIQVSPNLLVSPPKDLLSFKRVEPVENNWKVSNNCKIEIFSFSLNAKKISHLQEKVNGNSVHKIPTFESLCAIIWKSVAKTRTGAEPKVVTICKNGTKRAESDIVGNYQTISAVEAKFLVAKASLEEIGEWFCDRNVEDLTSIKEALERDQGLSDFILYGANLTFLDLEDSDIYRFEIKGKKPIHASCSIDGVGEEGVVLIIPDGKGGKVVTLIIPESEVLDLRLELETEFEIA